MFLSMLCHLLWSMTGSIARRTSMPLHTIDRYRAHLSMINNCGTYIGPHSYHCSSVIPHRVHGVHRIQGLLLSHYAKANEDFTIFRMPRAIYQARISDLSKLLEGGQSELCTAASYITRISSHYHAKYLHAIVIRNTGPRKFSH